MNIAKYKSFAVIAFSREKLQGAVFRRMKTKYELLRFSSLVPDPEEPVKSWKDLFRDLAISKDDPLILCGALKKGLFFRTSMAEIPVKAIRNALSLELPRRMLSTELEDMLIEFTLLSSGAEENTDPATEKEEEKGEIKVNAYALPHSSMEELSRILVQCGKKADAFLYPFLALQDSDPPLYLPETEKNYYFDSGSWQVTDPDMEDPAGSDALWRKIFQSAFKLPDPFPVKDFYSLLLCARFAISGAFHESEEGINILPAKLRPSRLKTLLKFSAVFLLLILLNSLWSCSGEWLHNRKKFSSLTKEKAALQEENRKLRARIRRSEKEGKELQRASLLKAGEHKIVSKLYDLTSFLPNNVMLSSMRWSDSGLDLTMFSENNSSISEIFRTKFPYWKLANIQQRNFGGAATMITVKLTNTDLTNEPEEGRRR